MFQSRFGKTEFALGFLAVLLQQVLRHFQGNEVMNQQASAILASTDLRAEVGGQEYRMDLVAAWRNG